MLVCTLLLCNFNAWSPTECASSYGLFLLIFLPMPLVVAWVNRWTFSSTPSSPSHHQLRYRKHHGGAWVFHCDVILFPFTPLTLAVTKLINTVWTKTSALTAHSHTSQLLMWTRRRRRRKCPSEEPRSAGRHG